MIGGKKCQDSLSSAEFCDVHRPTLKPDRQQVLLVRQVKMKFPAAKQT